MSASRRCHSTAPMMMEAGEQDDEEDGLVAGDHGCCASVVFRSPLDQRGGQSIGHLGLVVGSSSPA